MNLFTQKWSHEFLPTAWELTRQASKFKFYLSICIWHHYYMSWREYFDLRPKLRLFEHDNIDSPFQKYTWLLKKVIYNLHFLLKYLYTSVQQQLLFSQCYRGREMLRFLFEALIYVRTGRAFHHHFSRYKVISTQLIFLPNFHFE